jgi:23S rRNA (cytidine1920-2'-O)/16S rRNA (cytidine1409-2'-O)-methyltransferase
VRADQLVMQRGLAPTRSAAQRLIDGGGVRWLGPKGWATPRKAGEDLPEDCQLEITDDAELRYVSRGGLKLESALAHCAIDVTGMTCLDVGQSTGGFTDLLLQRGAAKVVGIEVGHGQLHPKLAADERVSCFEGVNARDVVGSAFAAAHAEGSFQFITGDLSFISLTLVLPTLQRYLAPGGHLLLLVKPQFELQPAQIGKGGLVRDKALFNEVETRIRSACRALPYKVHAYFPSAITGTGHASTGGNTEFFVWARPIAAPATPAQGAAS